jgi:hypothetical protein
LLYISELGRCHMTNAQVDMLVIKICATSFQSCPGRYSQKHKPLRPAPERLQGPSRCRSRHPKADEAKPQDIMESAPPVAGRKIRCASRYPSMLLLQADGGVISGVPNLELFPYGDAVPDDSKYQRLPAMQLFLLL